MNASDRAEGVQLEEAHQRLSDGLKSCRTVVTNYRSLLNADFDVESAARDAVKRLRIASADTLGDNSSDS